jgi:hypothetical protein
MILIIPHAEFYSFQGRRSFRARHGENDSLKAYLTTKSVICFTEIKMIPPRGGTKSPARG